MGSFEDGLAEMRGRAVRIKTPDAVYRGTCVEIELTTFSFLMFFHGSFVETACLGV